MPSEDAIESIKSTSAQRRNLWDRWQKVYEQMDHDLNPEKDPFESRASMHIMKMGRHLISQTEKEAGLAKSKHIHEHGIKKMKDAHNPSAGLIALYITQIVSGIVGTGLGCAPAAFAITGASAAACQATAQGVQSIFGQGSQNMASILQSGAQAEIAEINFEIERDKQVHADHANEQQNHQRMAQTHADDERKVEQSRHEATKAVTQ